MPKIETIRLRCPNPEAQNRFYCDTLGMSIRRNGTIGYSEKEAGLIFELGTNPYHISKTDLYWKIAISVPNIELAYQQLVNRGVEINTPEQFQDVGYLAHFKDPEGFTIEIIEHWFKGDRPAQEYDKKLLGGGPHINLLTLRTIDIKPIDKLTKAIGMTPLSIQEVTNRGFTLYFYAFTNEQPPNKNLHSIENRTWLYQRPYTVLEVMQYSGEAPKELSNKTDSGYMSAVISGLSDELADNQLCIKSKM